MCVTPQGVNGTPNVPKLYASGRINKYILKVEA